MISKIKTVLRKVLNKLRKDQKEIPEEISEPVYIETFEDIQAKRCAPWFRDNGDKTLRLEYDLSDDSIVFDIGGYEGQWSSDIFSMYCCSIYIFEPVETFAYNIKKRFAKNKKIHVYQHGLASITQSEEISVDGDSSSIFKDNTSSEKIYLVKAIDFIKENNISQIDLMKINIEGGEYDLLLHLLDSGFIENIDNIQVQFHDFFPDAEERMSDIQKKLEKTHLLTYQYPFVWENWCRN
ncbi:FkbM family methyltransferase [Pseudanabaena sp. UWO311]|uniref:FkbM family methyltransferase n=1 Tax=Pseudanabaena sp. UWO311 TaxID=2487337 RepID=UPI00115BB3C7|nr:FkbM family methyltransferase [Pseudanabaena sp. UWO311]TYQ26999.1 FkbM family methyltransferase [Pseudanabaena sp. UWO311]